MYQNRFWILCGVVAVASLGTWYLASSHLRKEKQTQESVLDQKKQAVDKVLATTAAVSGMATTDLTEVAVHPNPKTQDGMTKRLGEGELVALQAWRERRKSQEPHLAYPTVIPKQVADRLTQMDPPEKFPDVEIDVPYRETYATFIKNDMPNLAAIIGTKWNFEETEGTAPEESASPLPPVVVQWDAANQALWHDKLTQFMGRNGNTSPTNQPSTQQILAIQQDLWILKALFASIKAVNGDANETGLAAIKKIDHILIGPNAANAVGEVSEVRSESADESSTKTAKRPAPKAQGNQPGASASAQYVPPPLPKRLIERQAAAERAKSAPFDPAESTSPFHGRYVDHNYKPLSASELKSILTSTELTDQAPLVVAKRIPVRLAVIMDGRYIDEFLAACANSPFAFEVRQMRVNRHQPNEAAKLEGGARQKGGDVRMGATGGDGAGSQRVSEGGGDAPATSTTGLAGAENISSEQRTNYNVRVEFFGIVKIYNPVDPTLFQHLTPDQVTQVMAEPPAESSPPAAGSPGGIAPTASTTPPASRP
jgi:hypothetical protein